MDFGKDEGVFGAIEGYFRIESAVNPMVGAEVMSLTGRLE